MKHENRIIKFKISNNSKNSMKMSKFKTTIYFLQLKMNKILVIVTIIHWINLVFFAIIKKKNKKKFLLKKDMETPCVN